MNVSGYCLLLLALGFSACAAPATSDDDDASTDDDDAVDDDDAADDDDDDVADDDDITQPDVGPEEIVGGAYSRLVIELDVVQGHAPSPVALAAFEERIDALTTRTPTTAATTRTRTA